MELIEEVLGDFFKKYGGHIFFGVFVFFVSLGVYQYTSHRSLVNKQEAFIALEDMSRIVSKQIDPDGKNGGFTSEADKFAHVYKVASDYFKRYSGYGFSVYFLIICAKIDYKTKGASQAIETLENGLRALSNELAKEIIGLNLAILRLYSADKVLSAQGFADLEKLADYGKLVSDYAFYRLGVFCWQEKRNNEARAFWNTLIAGHKKVGSSRNLGESVWARKAKERLSMIA